MTTHRARVAHGLRARLQPAWGDPLCSLGRPGLLWGKL